MLVEVTKEKVAVTQGGHINSGEMNVNTCTFSLPECFEGLNVTACFNGIPVPIVKNSCIIPVLKQGTATLGVYAYKSGEAGVELVYSPEPTCFCVHKGSFSEELEVEPSFEISEYEQYCNMLKSEYEKTEALFSRAEEGRCEAERSRAKAEGMRQSAFNLNETKRQATFELNEQLRQASFDGAYTNLLKGVVDDTTLDLPTQFPCHKIGSWYNKDSGKFTANAGFDCYLFEVSEGDRILVSNYVTTGAMSGSMACVLDENFTSLYYTPLQTSRDLLGGLYAMPENAKYVALNTPSSSSVPNVTLVSESVIRSNVDVPFARKFIAAQLNGTAHLCYEGVVGGTIESRWGNNATRVYANGIYPLESGVEYVLHIPSLVDTEQYYRLAFLCDENFVVNRVVQQAPGVPWVDFDKNNRFVFTATENDKYIAINTYEFAPAQFGENKMKGVTKSVNIGNAVLDGMHDITLADMGVIDRSINKKFIAYGDSITLGVGIDYVNGEKRWTDYLVERYNIPEHINMGEGLTCISYVPTTDSYQGISMCRDERLNNLIAEAPDIVTIFGGANDYICDVPIGADDDMENKNIHTFKGAYAYIIDKILTAKPDTLILLLGMFTNTMGVYAEGKGTYPLKNYAIATKEIAEHFGLPFIDLNECGFNKYNFNTTDGVFSTDGIHPNKEGTKRIAMVVSKWFDTFKGTVF